MSSFCLPCSQSRFRAAAFRFSLRGNAPVAALVALIALGLLAGQLHAAADKDLTDFKAAQDRCEKVVNRITAATVGIINISESSPNAIAYGSGVIVSEDGIVLTAAHVIGKPQSELIIVFPDGRRVKATTLGADRTRDAGMAKITDEGKWPFVDVGHSAELKPEEWCLATGHPGGVQEGRTPPLRLGRILTVGKGGTANDGIRTDATMISGDSGGPLFDLDGNVIGINSSINPLVTQNRHVPIDVFHELRKDLLAGKQSGQIPANIAGPGQPPQGQSPQLAEKFQRLLREHVQARDPEALELLKNNRVDAKRMLELLAKWDSPHAADNKTIDYLKFHRNFEDRLIAGDKELKELFKDGKLLLTPAKMVELAERWEADNLHQALAAQGVDLNNLKRLIVERALAGDTSALARFKLGQPNWTPEQMKELTAKWEKEPKSIRDDLSASELDAFLAQLKLHPDGRLEMTITPENMFPVLPVLQKLGLAPHDPTENLGKGGQPVLSKLTGAAAGAASSIARVLCDGKPATLATVVRKDGYLVTKASDLSGKLVCKIGNRELPATIVKKNDDFDIALLKVEADNLTPLAWADAAAPLGAWLTVPSPEGKPLALGVVSIAARAIGAEPIVLVKNAAALGVQMGKAEDPAKIEGCRAGGPGEKAGLKAGDVILTINGQIAGNTGEVRQQLSKFMPGDKLKLEVQRGEEKLPFEIELGSAAQLSAPPGEIAAHKLDAMSSLGGTISKRHNNFPSALTHDAVIQAAQCGGPIVDLDGHAIGLNIARVDRTATYAIPAAKLKTILDELLPK